MDKSLIIITLYTHENVTNVELIFYIVLLHLLFVKKKKKILLNLKDNLEM